MSIKNNNKTKFICVFCSIILGAILGMYILKPMMISGKDLENPKATIEYQINESGYTYGSGLDAFSYEEMPDLIKATGTNGKDGYVYFKDLEGFTPSNPEEAVAYMEEQEKWCTELQNYYGIDYVPIKQDFPEHHQK